MNRLTQKETAGRNLVNDRYMLNECLFSSDVGILYKARDTQQQVDGAARSGVLIHFLPNRAITYHELPSLLPVLQNYTEVLDYPVLKVLDCGWSGTVAYFIMLAPDSWSVNVLPDLQKPPGSLHQSAIRITRDLLRKQVISTGLVPQAFLVMPGGLYLLPTALTECFQVLQRRDALLPLSDYSEKSGCWVSFLSWGMAVGFAAAGSGYIYHLYQQDEVSRNTRLQEVLAEAEPPVIMKRVETPLEVGDSLLVTESVLNISEPAQLDQPEVRAEALFVKAVPRVLRQTENHEVLAAIPASLNIQADEAVQLKSAAPAKQSAFATQGESVHSTPVAIEPADVEPEIAEIPSAASDISVESSTVRKAKKGSQQAPKLTANGLTSEQLIDSAYKAIRAGRLSESAGRGAIYYIRLVKRIDRGNPQINRMARQVVSAYHVKARDSIKNKQKNTARQLLWVAGRVIKEFNLVKMNKSHEMLQHRLSE